MPCFEYKGRTVAVAYSSFSKMFKTVSCRLIVTMLVSCELDQWPLSAKLTGLLVCSSCDQCSNVQLAASNH